MEEMLPSHSNRFEKGVRARSTHLHTVIFAVNKIRMDELRSILDDISNPFSANYGNHLTRAQVSALTTNVEGSQKLLTFLENHAHGDGRVEILEMTPNKDYITTRASVAQWESFFHTEFYEFHRKVSTESQNKNNEGSHFHSSLTDLMECNKLLPFCFDSGVFVRAAEYSLPSEVAADALGVFNVADLPINVKSNVLKGDKVPTPTELQAAMASPSSKFGTIVNNYVTPALLNKYYQIGSNTGNKLASQGVYETNNQWFSPSDLAAFESFMGVPSETVAVDIGGHSSNNSCATQGGDNCYEGNLDIQYMIGVSQVTPTTYYYIDEAAFIYKWLITLASSTSPPLVLSVSWGETENYLSAAYMTAVNNEAIILSAMGVTLVASSGDDGANGSRSACGYNPQFPSSSAYFTAVGATTVRSIQ